MSLPPNRRIPDIWLFWAVVGGVCYPLVAYFGRGFVSSFALTLMAAALIGLRLWGLRHTPEVKLWAVVFVVAVAALLGMAVFDAHMAALAYPIAVSLSVCAVFVFSLFFPPTIVERIARITESNLPPEGVIYTRRVTVAWVIFLLVNAGISAATACWGTLAQWTLWNGFLSYLCMGVFFAIEFIIRRRIKKRAGA